MIVAVLAGLVLIDRSLDDATASRLAERQLTIATVADAVSHLFDTAAERLRTDAAALEPWTGDPDADLLQVAEGQLAVPGLLGGIVVIVDTEGFVRVAGPDGAPLLGQQLAGTAIDRALAGSPGVSAILTDQEGRANVYLAVPVHDGTGSVTGAVVSRVDPTRGPIADLLRNAFPAPTRLALVTAAGSVVADEGDLRLAGPDDPNTQLPTQGSAAGIVPAYRGEADVVMTAVHARVRPGWRLVAFEPYDALRSPLRTPFWVAATVLGVVALLAGAGLVLAEIRARRAERGAEVTKRSLLAVAGHELRTPLTVVRGLGQTLAGRWDQLPDRNRLDMVRTIERQSRILDHLVERLLYAAQLESDAGGIVTARPIDVGRLVEQAVVDHGPLAPGHDLRADVDGHLVAHADAKAVDQVLFHLLDNAIRYSPGGGTVTVTASEVDSYVQIVVEDEGVGLPADVDSIFDRFVQGEAVTTRTVDEGGVGLGLHIVRTLVELMDGTVRAEPREPSGARFVVTLRTADQR